MLSNGNMTVSDCPFPGVQWDYSAGWLAMNLSVYFYKCQKDLLLLHQGEESQQSNVKRRNSEILY